MKNTTKQKCRGKSDPRARSVKSQAILKIHQQLARLNPRTQRTVLLKSIAAIPKAKFTNQGTEAEALGILSAYSINEQLEALERLCEEISGKDTGVIEEKGPAFEKATSKLIRYLDKKFSEEKAIRLLRRFYIEAAGAFAARTPSNLSSTNEHFCYDVEGLRKSLRCYTPLHQRLVLAEYIKTVLPEADDNYDVAEDESLLDVLFEGIDRGQTVRDTIDFIRKISTEGLRRLLSELESRQAEFGVSPCEDTQE